MCRIRLEIFCQCFSFVVAEILWSAEQNVFVEYPRVAKQRNMSLVSAIVSAVDEAVFLSL